MSDFFYPAAEESRLSMWLNVLICLYNEKHRLTGNNHAQAAIIFITEDNNKAFAQAVFKLVYWPGAIYRQSVAKMALTFSFYFNFTISVLANIW